MSAKKAHKVTLESLAGMVKGGFDHVDKRLEGVESRLGTLEKGQEEIKLKLDNVAYRFEVVELQRRVDLLERKMLHRKFVAR